MDSGAKWTSKGLNYSLLLHGFIILNLLIVVYSRPEPTMTERIVTVDLVNIKSGPITNLKNAPIKMPASSKPSASKSVAAQVPTPKTKSAVKNTASATRASSSSSGAASPAEKVSPAPSVRAIAKPVEPSSPQPQPQSQPQPNDSNRKPEPTKATMLERPNPDKVRSSDLEPAAVDPSVSSSKYTNSAMSDKPYDRTKPLTIAERDSIKMQIENQFINPIVSDFQPGELVIELKLKLSKDGEVQNITEMNSGAHSAKHRDAFLSLKDSLRRAAYKASPLYGLSPESYEGAEGWNEVLVTFDAHSLAQIG